MGGTDTGLGPYGNFPQLPHECFVFLFKEMNSRTREPFCKALAYLLRSRVRNDVNRGSRAPSAGHYNSDVLSTDVVSSDCARVRCGLFLRGF